MLESHWLSWARDFVRLEAAGGPEASTPLKLVPDTAVTAAAGCNASPCFVCELRATVGQALLREPRLGEDLRRQVEAREEKRRQRAKVAEEGRLVLPALGEAPATARPLALTILGLRRLNSLSDDFDDRMVVLCRLPTGAEAKEIAEATGSLLEALEKAAAEAAASVRVISCSSAPWLAALFTVTTDAGLQRRMSEVQCSLAITKKQLVAHQAKLDQTRQRQAQVRDSQLPQAQAALAEANQRLQAARAETRTAKDRLDEEHQRSKKIRPELDRLHGDLLAKQKAEVERTKAVGEATRVVGRLTRESDRLGQRIPILERAVQALEKQQAQREKAVAEKAAALDRKMVHLDEGQEGWTEEGRAMMLPGHYPDAYSYFIHHSSGESFASDTSLTALTVGYLQGLRLYSKSHICSHPGDFLGKEIGVREIRSASGPRRFATEEARLVVEKGAHAVSAAVQVSSGEKVTLQDGDVVFVAANHPPGPAARPDGRIGGTNLHRAHNARLAADGTLQGEPAKRVADWSWGCQTFPDCQEFNLFLRLCAVAKRWECASGYHEKGGAGCAVLEAGSGEALGPGEEALVARFGKEFLDRAGDANRAKRDPKIKAKQDRIEELTWNGKDQKSWERLTRLKEAKAKKGETLLPDQEKDLGRLGAKRSGKLAEGEQKELDGLQRDCEQWRREYLREKTRRLAADQLRVCDLFGRCQVRFSYTLVEMTAEELARIETAFQDPRNKQWNGKLL